ncbi:pyridoxal phosphate-dependent decarboxylase family protein [Vibrio hangzhouensis]|uniref:pyridoxal phosphate-dependent decarboxylase family protein n=1 Tax=Vibrio hangzhouensis TaxID=462991 RepID=UPI001C96391D|nr:aminotransferase class V-fold PLP-dependent enzyme [Vibrio hangzhouensis]MBY6195747.1 aminotransferase class V-fold PLP-dependent enzyme [Vibrio hangzhouensis]
MPIMQESNTYFPKNGYAKQEVLNKLDELKQQMVPVDGGRFGMYSLKGNEDIQDIVEQAALKFFSFNALFTFMNKPAGQIEDELIEMIREIFHGSDDMRANFTTGGSESIYCAMKAMRDWARETKPHIKEPELVMPYSAHSAFSRGGKYFGIKIVRTPVANDNRVDIEATKAAINDNTIGLIGSAPCWPFGVYDRIEELSDIAIEKGLWLHVDACVGGYLAPFVKKAGYDLPKWDFTVKGVRSISADMHKYGYAPKPMSTVLYRGGDEQFHHYTVVDDWPCGTYFSHSLGGSRTFASTAGAWAVMNYLGETGYIENAKRIMTIKEKLINGLAGSADLDTAHTDLSLLIIDSATLDITKVIGGMAQRGWSLLGNSHPPAIHLTIDPISDEEVERMLNDFYEVVEEVKSGESDEQGSLAYSGGQGEGYTPNWVRQVLEMLPQKQNNTGTS